MVPGVGRAEPARNQSVATREADLLEIDDATRAQLFGLLAVLADRFAEFAAGNASFGVIEGVEAPDSRFGALCESLRLDQAERLLLTCAIAPLLDARFARLFADTDPGSARPAPRVDIAATLCGLSLWSADVRAALGASGMLRRSGLLRTEGSGPLPTHTIVASERLVMHLLGNDEPDEHLLRVAAPVAAVDVPEVEWIANLIADGTALIWLHDRTSSLGGSVAATAVAALDMVPVVIDLQRHVDATASGGLGHRATLPGALSLTELIDRAVAEAVLLRGAVVATSVDAMRDSAVIAAMANPPCPLVLVSSDAWDSSRFSVMATQIHVQPMNDLVRREVWTSVLGEQGIRLDVEKDDLLSLATLRLGPGQIAVAATSAHGYAIAAGEVTDVEHLRMGVRSHGGGKLELLATRIQPWATFDDLVLPDLIVDDLRSIPGWMRTRDMVRREWGMARGSAGSVGVSCLFSGPSGTGKTLAAEVVAHSLGVDLFVIDLSQIVDKYIGETEKNLERVFSEAEGVNGVLLFDEADALFGKRSDVKSSNDRHANVEVAYLLQRMERYDGVAILTTNLRNNLDDAFTRRLDVILAFPEPGVLDRKALWQRHLPSTVPMEDDVDLDLLAEHLAVTGGIIRNIAMAAAHTAAIAGTRVGMSHFVQAAAREYRKVGRLFPVAELRAWLVDGL